MTTKHTPGPWTVINSHYPAIQEISGPSFKISCVMWATDLTEDDYQKRNADLHLIAAAPELLEILGECSRILRQAGFLSASKIADRAIAKAGGTT